MTARAEIAETLREVFAVQHQQWDSQNYPYWEDYGMYETHLLAAAAGAEAARNSRKVPKWRIVKKNLTLLSTGEIRWYVGVTVFDEFGVWLPNYDPRVTDPQWELYLQLKSKFEDAAV